MVFSKNIQKEKQTFEVVKKQTEQLKEIDSLFILEKEIIRILLLFGNQEADFVDFVEVENEDGTIHLEKEQYTNQVSKELYLNLQDDEIEFSNEIFKKIYYEMIHQLSQEDKIEIDNFINSPPTFKEPIIIKIISIMLRYFGTFFLLSHLISGRNSKAINIERMRGMKINDNSFKR